MYKKLIGTVVGTMVATNAFAATLSVVSSSPSVSAGTEFTVTITADFSDVGSTIEAGGFLLQYDSSLLTLVDKNASAALVGNVGADATGYLGASEFQSVIDPTTSAIDVSLFGDLINPGMPTTTADPLNPVPSVYELTFMVDPLADPTFTTTFLQIGQIGDSWLVDGANIITGDMITFNSATIEITTVPIPAAVWLFASGLLGLVGIARRRSTSSAVLATGATPLAAAAA